MRIVSLVPSQTELLAYLGLENEVAGITKFCIHPPEWFRTKVRVGGTKQLNFEKIRQLRPDLIIGNKEENEQSQILELMRHYPVWMSDVRNLNDALDMIKRVGEITGKKSKAERLAENIADKFNKLIPVKAGIRVAYCIWRNPYMVAGGDTFVDDMMRRCGFKNIFGRHESRYPQVTAEEIAAAMPDVVLLSSEPFPFREKHIAELKAMGMKSKILLVDGEMFSWYGSRLLKAGDYFRQIISKLGE